jgi:hypothetical protein
MTETTIDIHLPDRDVYEQDELDVVYSIKPKRVLALVFDADKGMAVQLGTMCRELNLTDVYLRPWASDIGHEPAKDWAQICFDRGERVRAELPDGTPIHMIPGNEMNLTGEGFDGDLPRLIQWLEDFGKAWAKIKGSSRYILHLPAPWSGDVGEDNQKAKDYWKAGKDKGLARYYQAVDCHAYADGFGLWKDCAAIWGKGPHITEYNRVGALTVLGALDPAQPKPAAAAFYFTSRWVCYENCTADGYRQDDQFSLTRYPEIREEIRAANAGELVPAADAPEPIPEPVPMGAIMDDKQAIEACLDDLWYLAERTPVVGLRAVGNALPDHWQAHMQEMGVPAGPERVVSDEDGPARAYRAFLPSGVWRWHRDDGVSKVA